MAFQPSLVPSEYSCGSSKNVRVGSFSKVNSGSSGYLMYGSVRINEWIVIQY
jgi:hypothetical protein